MGHESFPPFTPPRLVDDIMISGVTNQYSPGNSFSNNSFGLSFSSGSDTVFSNLSPGQVPNPGNFDFATSSFHGLSAGDASGGSDSGTITSIEMVPVPEPSPLVIFAVLGIAAKALWSGRTR